MSQKFIEFLAVEERPSIVKGLKDIETSTGNPVIMEIAVAKKPKVVKWYKIPTYSNLEIIESTKMLI